MRTSLSTRLFIATLSSTLLALVVAGLLLNGALRRLTAAQAEDAVAARARIAARMIEQSRPSDDERVEPQALAARLAVLTDAHITLLDASARVLGSGAPAASPSAASDDSGVVSTTVPVRHETVASLRLSVPRTAAGPAVETLAPAALAAAGLALLGSTAVAAGLVGRIGRRVDAIAQVAQRYKAGDLTPPQLDYGNDELGAVARTLDDSVQELGRHMSELQRDRGRMEAILSGMVEGVVVLDAQGRTQLVNNAARRMLRIDGLAVGRHYLDDVRHPAIVTIAAAVLKGQMPEPVQFSPSHDPSCTIMARGAPVVTGQTFGAVLVLHDITNLQRVDRIRRDFVANVSHELRTPLTAIRGYVEALAEGDVGEDEQRQFLGIITRHTLRMERLVRDLLRLAQLDAGQEVLDISPCDIERLVRDVVADFTSTFDTRRQQVEIAIGPSAAVVHADPAKLHDVLRNLIANASTYSPEGSTIRVSSAASEGLVSIAVSDEGAGIPEHECSRIFERFYRVEKSRARDPGGTGLGLAIVKHLVELHQGRVGVSNNATGGATFTVQLKADGPSKA